MLRLAKLEHANLPVIFAVCVEQPAVVMELMDGDLFQWINERKYCFSAFEQISVLEQIAAGMSYLHENGAVQSNNTFRRAPRRPEESQRPLA